MTTVTRVELAPGKNEREYVTIPKADIVDMLMRVVVGEFASMVIDAADAGEILKRLAQSTTENSISEPRSAAAG